VNIAFEPDRPTKLRLKNLFQSHEVASIRVSPAADIRDSEVSQVDISFDQGSGDASRGCEVSFKVLDQASDTHRYLSTIGPPPGLVVKLTAAGMELGHEEMCDKIQAFVQAIESRVAKVHKEQSILGTRPLGKTFLLYNKTRFEVLADNGEGQLVIKIVRKDGSDEASLSANDLLDGLYSGAITEV